MPSDWQRSIICPIDKKGDKLVCNNYRGISPLCVPYKLFTSILRDRLEPLAERIISEYQAGFRKGRSTIEQIFTVKQILEKC
jgi:sorting nexin-29